MTVGADGKSKMPPIGVNFKRCQGRLFTKREKSSHEAHKAYLVTDALG